MASSCITMFQPYLLTLGPQRGTVNRDEAWQAIKAVTKHQAMQPCSPYAQALGVIR